MHSLTLKGQQQKRQPKKKLKWARCQIGCTEAEGWAILVQVQSSKAASTD